MTEQEAYQAQHYAGQMAGQAKTAMLEQEIAARDYDPQGNGLRHDRQGAGSSEGRW